MKRLYLALTLLITLLTACGNGNQPASTPTLQPAASSQAEPPPQPPICIPNPATGGGCP